MIESAAQRLQPTLFPSAGTHLTPRVVSAQAAPCEPAASDALDLSIRADETTATNDSQAAREERVMRIRAEIAGGTYLTDDKLDAVVERLHTALFAE